MIRLPSGPPTSGVATGTGGSNTPTTNTAPSPGTPAVSSQPMQVVTSNAQSPTVGPQSFPGPGGSSSMANTNSVSVVVSSQGLQQPSGNSISGSSNTSNKNGINRPAPSPSQGQPQSNISQQPSAGNKYSNISSCLALYITLEKIVIKFEVLKKHSYSSARLGTLTTP